MKTINQLLCAFVLSASTVLAYAQTPPAPPAEGKGEHRMRDCSKIEDATRKSHCEARHAAMKAAWAKCKDKPEGPDRRTCMRENMVKPPQS